MPAYLIMTRHCTYDHDAMAAYSGLAAKAPSVSAKILASTKLNRFRVLEGREPEALAVIRFDTDEDALRWYESPEYQAARAVRATAGEFGVVLIECEDTENR